MSFSISSSPDFLFSASWDRTNGMFEDELSATSNEEANKVLEKWQADEDQDLDIMEVDEQIGTNLLGDELFDVPCVSPTGPLEELIYMNIDEDDDDERFFAPLLLDDDDEIIATPLPPLSSSSSTPYPSSSQASSSTRRPLSKLDLPFDKRYEATLKKLSESMKRSQETRKSLVMKTTKTEQYSRVNSISGVLTSIEKSSHQLQSYLTTINRQL